MTSKDETFRSFSSAEAAQYARGRGGAYPLPIYQAILEFLSNEQRKLFLDVGCGPGKAAFDMIEFFEQGIGCDTSLQMIEQAKTDAANLGDDVAKRLSFVVAGGEECCAAIPENEIGNVDLITVAMAVHWLSLPQFYASAARALRSGGTLAIWTCSSFYCHPSTPNAHNVQGILNDLEDNMLGSYATPGNKLSRNAYENLSLPWSSLETADLFDKTSFVRKDWDLHGVPSAPRLSDGSLGSFLFGKDVTSTSLAEGFNAASMVVRWRQANPEKAGGVLDPVNMIVKRLDDILGKGAVFSAGPSCSLLLLRRT